MTHETFFSVDIEASGPIPGGYSMLSLGACVIDDTLERVFYAEIQPITLAADVKALAAIGRTLEEFTAHGEPAAAAMQRFAAWVRTETGGTSPIFVGFNAPFDWSFVNWYFVTYCGKNPFGVSALDIKSYYMGLCRIGDWAETRSSRIRPPFVPSSPPTHHALDDAKAQAEMFRKMRSVP